MLQKKSQRTVEIADADHRVQKLHSWPPVAERLIQHRLRRRRTILDGRRQPRACRRVGASWLREARQTLGRIASMTETRALDAAGPSRKLAAAKASIAASALLAAAKLAAGLWSGSLALLSEAGHAFVDTGATVLTYYRGARGGKAGRRRASLRPWQI